MKKYYAPKFIDESVSLRGKKTGKLSGFLFTRTFYRSGRGAIRARRGIIPFHWSEDTEDAKGKALKKVIKGMREMPELENNPPLGFIPTRLEKII